ncbi:MAG: tetratricopeptide repeat protein [bacterium]
MKYSSSKQTWWVLGVAFVLLAVGCAHKPPSFKEQVKEALDLYYAGEHARQAGNLEAAAGAYRHSLRISPRPIVHLHLAHVLIDLGRFDEAQMHLDRALEKNPEYTLARYERERLQAKVTVVQRTGDRVPEPGPLEPFPVIPPDRMAVSPEEGVPPPAPGPVAPEKPSLSPEQQQKVDALLAQAQKALAEGKPKEAIAAHKSCIEIAPDRGEFYYYLANAYLSVGDMERAHLEYRRAIELDPNLPGAFNNLGVVYENKGQTEEAIAAYREAIRVGDHTDAYYNLAVLLEKRGQWEEALKYYRIYLERDATSSWANTARKQIRALERALY